MDRASEQNIPNQVPVGPRLNEECACGNDPVHEPWRKLRWVRCLQSFVGSEEGEQRNDAIELRKVFSVR